MISRQGWKPLDVAATLKKPSKLFDAIYACDPADTRIDEHGVCAVTSLLYERAELFNPITGIEGINALRINDSKN